MTQPAHRRAAAAAVLAAGMLGAAVSATDAGRPAPVLREVTVTLVAALTGPNAPSPTRGVDVCGTDLGVMAELGGRVYFAFGDTFGFAGDACPRFGPNWRSNVVAATDDLDPSDGVRWDWWLTGPDGRAVAAVEGRHEKPFAGSSSEQTRLPTAMIGLGGTLYLHLMSVQGFAAKSGEWTCNGSSFAVSRDAGRTWTATPPANGRGSNFNMLALTAERGGGNEDGRHVYALGTPCGRFGGVRLARFRPADILKPGAWEYLSGLRAGRPTWGADPAGAAEVIEAPVGEASILWNPYLGRWMYTYLNEATASLELREAPAPWGPWSAPMALARAADYPQLYGAFMTPSFLKDGGRTLYFVMSMFGPYNAYLMKASLTR